MGLRVAAVQIDPRACRCSSPTLIESGARRGVGCVVWWRPTMAGDDGVTDFYGLPLDQRLIWVAGAALLGGFLRGFVGFGGALVTVPVLSLAYGPHLAVGAASVMALPSVLQLLPEAVRHAERPVVIPIGLAVFLATPLGSWILVSASPAIMKIAISGLVVVMVSILATGWTFKGTPGLTTLITAGALGGLVQGSAGIGGPPVVAIALSRPGGAKAQRANVLGVMTAIALSSLAPATYYGLYSPAAIVIGLAMLPVFTIATALGSHYFTYGGHHYFRQAALATLMAVGASTLGLAIYGYLAG